MFRFRRVEIMVTFTKTRKIYIMRICVWFKNFRDWRLAIYNIRKGLS